MKNKFRVGGIVLTVDDYSLIEKAGVVELKDDDSCIIEYEEGYRRWVGNECLNLLSDFLN